MNWKKILSNGVLIAVIIAMIAFIPHAGERLLSWLFPPRLYVLIGAVIVIILLKILIEMRNKRSDDE